MDENNAGPLIELRNLVKAYGENEILKNIDLFIANGEFLVLVGPSGCGKSTLLRCIAGLETISGGELYINNRLSNKIAPKERDLAMVFQSYALYPHLTVRQNLAFSLTVRKMKSDQIEYRVSQVAERLGLSELLDRFPKQLSGGQRQRVAVGRAIVRRPIAFLFDEPLSNLDAELRGHMRIELKKLHRDLGATMIYVTHDQIEAMTLADRIVVLKDGIIQQVGAPEELYHDPDNMFVARFIGSPPMNFFNGNFNAESLNVESQGVVLHLAGSPQGNISPSLKVVAGVRPLNLKIDSQSAGSLKGTVEVVEPVGWDAYIHVDIGGQRAVAQVDAKLAASISVGDSIKFGVETKDVHLFDPESEKKIPFDY